MFGVDLWIAVVGEDGLLGVVAIVSAQGIADGLGRASGSSGDFLGDFVEFHSAVREKFASLDNDAGAFVGGELAEGGGAAHQVSVGAEEPLDRRLLEHQCDFSIREGVAPSDESACAPSGDGLGGNTQTVGQVFDGMEFFGCLGGRSGRCAAEVVHEGGQIA